MSRTVYVLLILQLVLLSACAETQKKTSGTPTAYADNAEQAYVEALDQFRGGNYLRAEPMFRKVRKEYPFSRFAALAELRVADCLLNEKKYAEAIQAYQEFIRFRPSHHEVPYARFKIAQAHFEEIPTSWLLAPPPYKRDLGAAHEALHALRRYLVDFPDDPRVPDAHEMMQKVVELLAKHELYVARFYLHRDVPKAAVARLQTLLNAYEGSPVEPEAMLLLGNTYLELHDRDRARRTFQVLVKRHPKAEQASEARRRLKKLGPGVPGPAGAKPAKPPAKQSEATQSSNPSTGESNGSGPTAQRPRP